jgi:hypothetical protein
MNAGLLSRFLALVGLGVPAYGLLSRFLALVGL